MALLAGLDLGFLHGVRLQELVEVLLLAPVAVEVVVGKLAGLEVGDDGVRPVR